MDDFNDKQDKLVKMQSTDDEPQHVIWNNIKIKSSDRKKVYILSFIILIVFLAVVVVVSIFSENKFDSIMPEDYVVVELEYENSTEQCQPDIGIE